MMRKIVFATNNQHKLDEIRKITEGKIEILSLSDIGSNDEIEETGNTLEENALIKARFIKINTDTIVLPKTRVWKWKPWEMLPAFTRLVMPAMLAVTKTI